MSPQQTMGRQTVEVLKSEKGDIITGNMKFSIKFRMEWGMAFFQKQITHQNYLFEWEINI